MRKWTTLFIALMLLSLSVPLPVAATSYKWEDGQGNLHIVNQWIAVPEEYRDTMTIIADGVIDESAPEDLKQPIDLPTPTIGDETDPQSSGEELRQKMGFIDTIKRIYWTLSGKVHPDFFDPQASSDSAVEAGDAVLSTEPTGSNRLPMGEVTPSRESDARPGGSAQLPPGMPAGQGIPNPAAIGQALNGLTGGQSPISKLSFDSKVSVVWRAAKRSGLDVSFYVLLALLVTYIGLFIFSFKITKGSIRWFTRIVASVFLLGGGSVITTAMSFPLLPQFSSALTEEMIVELKEHPPLEQVIERKTKSITDDVRERVNGSIQDGYNRSTLDGAIDEQ